MNRQRPDLGVQLRSILGSQAPAMQNIPVHSDLGAQIRRGFMTPARGRSFCAFDFAQQEVRLAMEGRHARTRPVL